MEIILWDTYLALLKYKNENLYTKVRIEILDYLLQNKDNYEGIVFETEVGILNFDNYINYISQTNAWGCNIEKNIAMETYDIYLVNYKVILNQGNNKHYHAFQFDHKTTNYNKDLCIFI